jgi:hypothetical protein
VCEYTALDITTDVEALREWRRISGGVGVPVLAHGLEIVIGFNAERYRMMVDAAGHCSPMEADGPGGAGGPQPGSSMAPASTTHGSGPATT